MSSPIVIISGKQQQLGPSGTLNVNVIRNLQTTNVDIGATDDLILGGRGATITLNQSGNVSLVGFTATSLVGALNEVMSTKVINTRTLTAGAGLTGGGDLTANRTFDVVAANASIVVNADSIQIGYNDAGGVVQLTDSTTGTVGVDVTPAHRDHRHGLPSHLTTTSLNATYVPLTRTLTAGNGLTGLGDLSTNRTVDLGTPSSITTSSTNSVAADSHTHLIETYDATLHLTSDLISTYPNNLISLGQGNTSFPGGVEHTLITGRAGSDNRVVQFASTRHGGSSIPNVYFRTAHTTDGGGGWTSFQKIWHDGNDGVGSGLDADLFQGVSLANIGQNVTFEQVINQGTIDNDVTLGSANRIILRSTTDYTADVPVVDVTRSNTGGGTGINVTVAGTDEGVRVVHNGTAGAAISIDMNHNAATALLIDVGTNTAIQVNGPSTGLSLTSSQLIAFDNPSGNGRDLSIIAGSSTGSNGNGGNIFVRAGRGNGTGVSGPLRISTSASDPIAVNGTITMKADVDITFAGRGSSIIPFNDGTNINLTGFSATSVVGALNELVTTKVPNTRTVTAGAGLTGGGDLSANRAFDVVAANSSIVVNTDSIQVGYDDSIDPTQLTDSITGADGTAIVPSRRDHRHGLPAHLVQTALDTRYVNVTGDTMTGALTINRGTGVADTSPEFGTTNSTYTIRHYSRLTASAYNPLVQANDSGIIFSADNGTGAGALVIAPWGSANVGLRLSATGDTILRSSSSGDLLFSGRNQTNFAFNDASNLTLSGFTATSIIGALNELKTSITSSNTLDEILNNVGFDNTVTLPHDNRITITMSENSTNSSEGTLSIIRTNTANGSAIIASTNGLGYTLYLSHTGSSGGPIRITGNSASGAAINATGLISGSVINATDSSNYTVELNTNSLIFSGTGTDNRTITVGPSFVAGLNLSISAGFSSGASFNGGNLELSSGAPGSGGTAGGVTINAHSTVATPSVGEIKLKATTDVEFIARGSSSINLNDSTNVNIPASMPSIIGGLTGLANAQTLEAILNSTTYATKDNDVTLASANRVIFRSTTDYTADAPVFDIIRTNTGAGSGINVSVAGTDEGIRIRHTGSGGNSLFIDHDATDAAVWVTVDSSGDRGVVVADPTAARSILIIPAGITTVPVSSGAGPDITIQGGQTTAASQHGGNISLMGGVPGAGGTYGGIAISAHATPVTSVVGEINFKSTLGTKFQANGSSTIPLNEASFLDLPNDATSIMQALDRLYDDVAVIPTTTATANNRLKVIEEKWVSLDAALNTTYWQLNATGGSAAAGAINATLGWAPITLSTGTTTTGNAYIGRGLSAVTAILNTGLGRIAGRWIARLPTASDATNTFTAHIGFAHNQFGGFRGGYFIYTHGTNSGNWQFITDNGSGTKTTTNTSVAGASATSRVFEVVINAANTEVKAFIDGTLVATHTTNLPPSIGMAIGILKSAGTTARTFEIFHSLLRFERTTPS